MGIRITTWNVNGIRNPFGYQPWRDKRSFVAMFDILEADIVVFQETKIQRKDLVDDMVLVPGWDNYWSLPKHKKGYSGVVIYTRNATCAPMRAEEGITGLLNAPNGNTTFRELPEDQQIGGYPSLLQLSQSEIDPLTLDSEGRCVILEFPAFVLVGTYCPAERDETRASYRMSFLNVLDARIRNLSAMGKRVIWTGDLNISRAEIDTAAAEEAMKKQGIDQAAWISAPARRLFNQLLVGGKVIGERDEGREEPVLWDITRGFHEGRRGMYTCWETKVNARPGNYGARIDYVVCSRQMKDWFSASDIQEGLMGSDHCPVYAVTKDTVELDGQERHILDIVNPPGMFENGLRKKEWSNQNLLPTSGKLIQAFDKRQNIRDMFSRVSTTKTSTSQSLGTQALSKLKSSSPIPPSTSTQTSTSSSTSTPTKRKSEPVPPPAKKSKTTPQTTTNGTAKGQKSLKGFFAARTVSLAASTTIVPAAAAAAAAPPPPEPAIDPSPPPSVPSPQKPREISPIPDEADILAAETATLASKKSWGRLFSKPIAPKCEHEEPCKTMVTKKKGENCGRSFWMCARPLGPSGQKEKRSQWRCQTFIWCSDWDAHAKDGEG